MRVCEHQPIAINSKKPLLPQLPAALGPWAVRGDGVTEPFSVYTRDASYAAIGFLPFGFSLPGLMEQVAHELAAQLNSSAEAPQDKQD